MHARAWRSRARRRRPRAQLERAQPEASNSRPRRRVLRWCNRLIRLRWHDTVVYSRGGRGTVGRKASRPRRGTAQPVGQPAAHDAVPRDAVEADELARTRQARHRSKVRNHGGYVDLRARAHRRADVRARVIRARGAQKKKKGVNAWYNCTRAPCARGTKT